MSGVCFEAGFKNLSHFSMVFREQFGYTPAALIR
ncbi:MAG: helix-turn-helix domain-containing protein [Prevotellaceae bacterium]|nr:helix-turn-helix domain-containing protein [Prevotellaceae bacterium]